jgi:prophage DNA circulation protein
VSWREELRDASFRGIAFKWRDTGGEPGRRVAVHEYPLKEKAESEDLGGKAVRGSINAWVLGDSYRANRDALLEALGQPGPGVLVHPTRGELSVQILDFPWRESTEEGGMARFQISYLEAEELSKPSSDISTAGVVATLASAASDAADAQFSGDYNATTTSQLAAAKQSITQALAKLEGYIGAAQSAVQTIQAIAAYPSQIAAEFNADILQIKSLANLKNLFGVAFSSGSGDASAQANDRALNQLVKTQAVIAASLLSAQTNYSSRDDALAVQQVVLDQIDLLSYQVNDDLYAALAALRSAVVTDIVARSADLARITSYMLPETAPALVIAQRLYGTNAVLDASEEIIARNKVLHPGFVPGGTVLEVLSDWAAP